MLLFIAGFCNEAFAIGNELGAGGMHTAAYSTAKLLRRLEIPVLGAALVPYIRDSPLARLIVSSISVLISKMGVYVVIYIHIHTFF